VAAPVVMAIDLAALAVVTKPGIASAPARQRAHGGTSFSSAIEAWPVPLLAPTESPATLGMKEFLKTHSGQKSPTAECLNLDDVPRPLCEWYAGSLKGDLDFVFFGH
jgi:hypothetical protein